MSIHAHQKLRLHPDYFESVRRGDKCSTIRAGKRNFHKGLLILESNHENLTVAISKISYKRFQELTDEDARLDGFANVKALRKALYKFYPNLRDDSLMTIINFRLPDYNNI